MLALIRTPAASACSIAAMTASIFPSVVLDRDLEVVDLGRCALSLAIWMVS